MMYCTSFSKCQSNFFWTIGEILINSHDYFRCKLKEAVLEGGIPFNMIHGMHAFEYPSVDPKFNEIFNKAMYHQSTYIIKKVLTEYKGFTNIKQLVDVGGGLGHTLRIITSKHPNIQGVNFDLSHVIEQAPTYPGMLI